MRHATLKSCLIGIVFLLFGFVGSAQKTTPAPGPTIQERDFGKLPDPTNQPRIRYHQFDKTLLTFSTSAQYVLVPVVVTDKSGHAVTGLTKESFRLQENGKEQTITSLEEFKPVSTADAGEAKLQARSPNATAPRQLVIIAFDMVNTPVTDQPRERQQLISYLADTLEPNTTYLLVSVENNGLRIWHDYTQSSSELIASVKEIKTRFPTTNRVDNALLHGDMGTINPPADPRVLEKFIHAEELYAEARIADAASSTLLAFRQIAEYVSKVPGRKSLVWVTGGFPFSIDPATWSINQGVSFEDYQHSMQLLTNQMIAVYSVDARGILTLYPSADMHLVTAELNAPSDMFSKDANRQRDILDTLRAFSDMTGGRAFVNTNDTRGAIREAVHDGSAYYLVTYPVDKSNRHQGWRKISVKVGNYHVRARKGYFLTKVTADAKDL